MTTEKEQEAFGLVIERHKTSASENDIRAAFQRFMETAGIADLDETTTEGPPGIGNPGRMDLYLHNTCIEFKKDIVRNGLPVRDYIEQLDGYLESLLKAGTGVRNGILTDGVNYFLRRVGEEKLPPATASSDEHLRPCRTGTPPAGIPARDRIGPSRRPQTHSRELGTLLRE